MGRGDKRSFKGKVFKGSYGKTRLRNKKKAARDPEEEVRLRSLEPEPGSRRKASFLRRRGPPERGVAVREASEAPDDHAVLLGPLA